MLVNSKYSTRNMKPLRQEVIESGSSFPVKLLHLLMIENDDIIQWLPHGQSFKVNDTRRFCAEIAPHYFKHTKMTSFQRQLNLYGFRRVIKGEEQGAYFHPYFQRDRPDLVHDIKRVSMRPEDEIDPNGDGQESSNLTHDVTRPACNFSMITPKIAEMIANTRCRKPLKKFTNKTESSHSTTFKHEFTKVGATHMNKKVKIDTPTHPPSKPYVPNSSSVPTYTMNTTATPAISSSSSSTMVASNLPPVSTYSTIKKSEAINNMSELSMRFGFNKVAKKSLLHKSDINKKIVNVNIPTHQMKSILSSSNMTINNSNTTTTTTTTTTTGMNDMELSTTQDNKCTNEDTISENGGLRNNLSFASLFQDLVYENYHDDSVYKFNITIPQNTIETECMDKGYNMNNQYVTSTNQEMSTNATMQIYDEVKSSTTTTTTTTAEMSSLTSPMTGYDNRMNPDASHMNKCHDMNITYHIPSQYISQQTDDVMNDDYAFTYESDTITDTADNSDYSPNNMMICTTNTYENTSKQPLNLANHNSFTADDWEFVRLMTSPSVTSLKELEQDGYCNLKTSNMAKQNLLSDEQIFAPYVGYNLL